jgi:hypothetical protein
MGADASAVILDRVLIAHQAIGYPVALVLGPLALASFAGRWRHRLVGIGYAIGMLALYLTGTAFTLTQYRYGSWEFARNVVFNLTGAMYVALGVRAGVLWRRAPVAAAAPAALDRALRFTLTLSVSVMIALAVVKSTPLRVFSILSAILLWMEWRDWRQGVTRATHYARHARYSLAGYFYLMTVLSIVHLRDEIPGLLRWIWPALLGALTIWIVHGAVTPGNPRRTRTQRPAIVAALVASLALAGYAVWEVSRDGLTRFPNHPPAATPRP